jgi:hypothetical protein
MKRRALIKLILALPGLAPALGYTAPHRPATPQPRQCNPPDYHYPGNECQLGMSTLLQESPLAGFDYYQGENIWPHLQEGEPLQLIREPENQYDKRAVALYWNEHKLGFLPRRENITIAQMLDRGTPCTARIIRLRETANPWGRIRVAVSLMREL